jgi:hypothetical protein
MPNITARKRSFQEILHDKSDIDYTEKVPATAVLLSTPKPTDTLMET